MYNRLCWGRARGRTRADVSVGNGGLCNLKGLFYFCCCLRYDE